ncbi:MAG: dicarboxylate/amino acid:cation symporter [Gemmatimonadetes bacterium]|nr:dicarboxylate/amino acid:cation symporter [Gemmatimonadota bacterium]
MSLTTKVLIALVAGLATGIAISVLEIPAITRLVPVIEPLGTLWINAIRMTVIPLVVGSIIVGVTAAPDPRTIGRVGGRALLLFVTLLVAGAVFAALVAPPLFALLPIDPAAADALRASASQSAGTAGESAQKLTRFSQWVIDLVPTNPVKAAADGALLPLIIFSVALGLAIGRISAEGRDVLRRFFTGVADSALTMVRWVLALAPVGVFALSVPLAARLGLSAAGALLGYIVVTSAVCVVFGLVVLYPLAAITGRISMPTFARAILPAQAVAFSARSSLASLPAMMDMARTRLALPEHVAAFFLPLAASTFRIGGALGITTGIVFIARLYGIELGPSQLASIVLTVVLTTFSIPGIPAGSIVAMVPAMMAAGVPVEGMGVLLAVDTVPDMFRTTANVTGDMAAAVVISRGESPAS